VKTFIFASVSSLASLFALFGFSPYQKPVTASVTSSPPSDPAAVTFRLDPSKSTFMVHADRAGLGWFKGKSHRIAVRDFSGEASLSLDAVNPASLTMDIKSASLVETGAVFTEQQKGIINKEVNELVLETAKYPDITFKSTEITGRLNNGAFDVRVTGDMTLHGVTRKVTIPATVTIDGDTFRAKGVFAINRKNFGVNATEAFHGFVKVRHTIKFVFDIVGEKI
jgi:polyisoprenoid-binding protein YceI